MTSKNMQPFNPAASLPAELASVFDAGALAGDLSEGAGGGGFPVLSIRGSKWRAKQGGEEFPIINDDGDPVPALEVVILKSSPNVSKLYYEAKYTEGDDAAPTCMSMDGIKPDASSESPQSKDCATCKWNKWGSRITEAGKKAKRCSDTRRVAVWVHTEMPDGFDERTPMLLRVPAASLNDLATFGNALSKKGYPYNALVTRLGFDVNASYPKLTYKAVRPITNDEAGVVAEMFNSETTQQILSTYVEEAAGEVEGEEEEEKEQPPEQTVDVDFEEPPAQPRTSKKKAAKKKAAKKATAKAAPPAEEPETGGDEGSLDDDLDSVLSDLENLV